MHLNDLIYLFNLRTRLAPSKNNQDDDKYMNIWFNVIENFVKTGLFLWLSANCDQDEFAAIILLDYCQPQNFFTFRSFSLSSNGTACCHLNAGRISAKDFTKACQGPSKAFEYTILMLKKFFCQSWQRLSWIHFCLLLILFS